MKSPFQEEEGPTPAKLCALYDLGGGVRLADSFAIYSIVAFPPEWATIKIDPIACSQLERAASLVASKIPILSNLRDHPLPNLVSLPCPPRAPPPSNGRISPCDQLPWFLIHAARFPQHCVLGRSDSLISLLVVLQRPWCVLELCCCETPTIAALHEFASLALELDCSRYNPAFRLLAHELSHRKHNSTDVSEAYQFAGATQSCTKEYEAFITYRALSRSCLRSHNPFWIGLISTCAVYLGLAFSDLTQMLGDLVSGPRSTSAERSSALDASSRALSSEYGTHISQSSQPWSRPKKLVLLRRHSIDVVPHSKEDPQISGRSSIFGQPDPLIGGAQVRDLLQLYAKILKGFREDL
jgi:hypothetical protein